MNRVAGFWAAVLFLAGCCTAEAPRRMPPPPPPPPIQQGPIVVQPPPPPPPPPQHGNFHPATPIPTTQMAVNAQQAEQIAVQYAQSHGFNVQKVKRVDLYGRYWEVRIQGHPPTPGKMRVLVDAGNGQVAGMDQYWGEGHGKNHGHSHYDDDDDD